MKLLSPIMEGSEKIGLFWYTVSGLCGFIGSMISLYAILLHLKNYRRPDLQRMTLRIMLMVPIYAFASFISLSSRYFSFYIDMVRDLYEAFVIYTFFTLLINYMGGERALLITLEHRLRTPHLWPLNYVFPPVDMSDPETFLSIRRGILQFVLAKPIIALFIAIFKIAGLYHEGYVAWTSTSLWLSLLSNLSVCWSMYCLVIFYLQCSRDLAPYRPFPKFICVKAIIFFSFWQGLIISFLVAAGVVRGNEDGYSANNIALALQDMLILLEIIPLAFLHWYAFPWEDFDSTRLSTRLPLKYAIRDVIGIKDVIQDTYHTLLGTTYGVIETVTEEDLLHREMEDGSRQWVLGGDRRFFGGRGGKAGYGALSSGDSLGVLLNNSSGDSRRKVGSSSKKAKTGNEANTGGSYQRPVEDNAGPVDEEDDAESEDDSEDLRFDDPTPDEECGYDKAREMVYGDSNFPVISTDPRFSHPPAIQRVIEQHTDAWVQAQTPPSKGKEAAKAAVRAFFERNETGGEGLNHVNSPNGQTLSSASSANTSSSR